jgi:hypothetical protein
MPGANAPAVRVKENTRRHHRFAGRFRHSLRDGVTAYFELSLVIGLSCHHPRREARASSPG